MIEISLLKIFLNRKNFDAYFNNQYINPKFLTRESVTLLKAYKEYYSKFHNQELIDLGEFKTFFFCNLHPNMDDTGVKEYTFIIEKLQETSDISKVETIIQGFNQQEFYNDLRSDLDNNIEIKELESKVSQFNQSFVTLSDEDPKMDLEFALETTDRTNGLKWRLDCLNKYHGPVVKGDFILIAARPDAGKSSFLASELSYMAQQLEGDDYILWGVNERTYSQYLMRTYCATLGKSRDYIQNNKDNAILKYQELMQGNTERIKIIDIHRMSAKDLENKIRKKMPKLLVIDLMDKINGFDKYLTKESNQTKFEKLYNWGGDIATLECPVIATTQTSVEAYDKAYPNMQDLRNSKIEKQGAVTALMFIGAKDVEKNIRYLSMAKVKNDAEGANFKAILEFNPQTSRFKE